MIENYKKRKYSDLAQLEEDSYLPPHTPSHHLLSDVASKSEEDDDLSYIDTTTTSRDKKVDMTLRTRYYGGGGPRKLLRKNSGDFVQTYKGEVLGDANRYYDY